MKSKKFLALAMVAATLTLAVVPSAFADDTGTASVNVSASAGSKSVMLYNNMKTPDFAVAALAASQTDTVALTAGTDTATDDILGVLDAEGVGAKVKLATSATWSFDDSATFYTGLSSSNYGSLTVVTDATPGNDQAYLALDKTGSTKTITPSLEGCSVTSAAISLGTAGEVPLSATPVVIYDNASICGSAAYVNFGDYSFVGPADGLGVGAYTLNATATLYDHTGG